MFNIPAGLPTSCVVLDHFSSFCSAFPRASQARAPRDQMGFFAAFLRRTLPEAEVSLILKRAEYPL